MWLDGQTEVTPVEGQRGGRERRRRFGTVELTRDAVPAKLVGDNARREGIDAAISVRPAQDSDDTPIHSTGGQLVSGGRIEHRNQRREAIDGLVIPVRQPNAKDARHEVALFHLLATEPAVEEPPLDRSEEHTSEL